MDSQQLASEKMPRLREIARELGLPGVKAESAEALRLRITVAMYPDVLNDLQKPPVDRLVEGDVITPRAPVERYDNTQEMVIEALTPFKSRLKLAFSGEENTWHVRNGVAEDSGSMNMPLKIIKLKAQHVYNARLPAKVDSSEFGGGLVLGV